MWHLPENRYPFPFVTMTPKWYRSKNRFTLLLPCSRTILRDLMKSILHFVCTKMAKAWSFEYLFSNRVVWHTFSLKSIRFFYLLKKCIFQESLSYFFLLLLVCRRQDLSTTAECFETDLKWIGKSFSLKAKEYKIYHLQRAAGQRR